MKCWIALIGLLSGLLLAERANALVLPDDAQVRMAELVIDPAQMEAFKAAVTEGMQEAVRSEPGVFALYAVAKKDSSNTLLFFEIYASDEAYQAHLQSPHFRKFFETTKSMVLKRTRMESLPFRLEAKP
jgi:quinol monooxygenase YgiN